MFLPFPLSLVRPSRDSEYRQRAAVVSQDVAGAECQPGIVLSPVVGSHLVAAVLVTSVAEPAWSEAVLVPFATGLKRRLVTVLLPSLAVSVQNRRNYERGCRRSGRIMQYPNTQNHKWNIFYS